MTMIYLYEDMPKVGIKYLEDALKKVEKDLEKLSDEFIKDNFRDAQARISTTVTNFHDEMKKPERVLELLFEFNRHVNNLCNDLEYLVLSGNYRYHAIFVKVDYFLFYLTQIAYLFKVNEILYLEGNNEK